MLKIRQAAGNRDREVNGCLLPPAGWRLLGGGRSVSQLNVLFDDARQLSV